MYDTAVAYGALRTCECPTASTSLPCPDAEVIITISLAATSTLNTEYVFCESYAALFLALDLIDRGHSVCVITNHAAIADVCPDLGLPFLLLCFGPTPDRGGGGFWRELQLRRLDVWVSSNIAAGSHLYFTHTQYSITAFALVKAWVKHGPVSLWDAEQTYPQLLGGWLRPDVWRAQASRARLWLFAGLGHLQLREAGGAPLLSIGDSFIHRYGVRRLPIQPGLSAARANVARRNSILMDPVRNLLCTQPVSPNYPVVTRTLEDLYQRIGRHDAAVKLHPRDRHDHSIFNGFKTYPSHLPAELMLGNVSNAVIALHSSVLLTAAVLPSCKAVSLLELVEWTDAATKSTEKEFMQKESGGAVYFPRTLEELDRLLEDDTSDLR